MNAIGNLGSVAKSAVPVLVRLLKDSDRRIQEYAATALGKIGPVAEPAVPVLMELVKKDLDCCFIRALGLIGPGAKTAVLLLMELVEHKDPEIQLEAVKSLGNIGPVAGKAVPRLVRILNGCDHEDWLLEDEIRNALKKILKKKHRKK